MSIFHICLLSHRAFMYNDRVIYHMEVIMYIGDIIKAFREEHQLSQETFAAKAGLTITEINILEQNFQNGLSNTCTSCDSTNKRHRSSHGTTNAGYHESNTIRPTSCGQRRR